MSDRGTRIPLDSTLFDHGETTVSVQWRCPQMGKHDSTPPLAIPCEHCYSLIVTAVRVPYLPKQPSRVVVKGKE